MNDIEDNCHGSLPGTTSTAPAGPAATALEFTLRFRFRFRFKRCEDRSFRPVIKMTSGGFAR